jgi:RNA recognition motif-containing protein
MSKRLLGKRLHVGHLSDETTEADLREMFSKYGLVTLVTINRDAVTGASWGFGRVVMDTKAAARAAVKGAHGQVLCDRDISVRLMRRQ